MEKIIADHVDHDIEQMLEEALIESKKDHARRTFEYALGRSETLSEMFKARYEQALDSAIPVAEVFNKLMLQKFPPNAVYQTRIGIDPSSGMPVALFVLSESFASEKRNVQMKAREVEVEAFSAIGFDGMIWTMVKSQNLDFETLAKDFPYMRTVQNVDEK